MCYIMYVCIKKCLYKIMKHQHVILCLFCEQFKITDIFSMVYKMEPVFFFLQCPLVK